MGRDCPVRQRGALVLHHLRGGGPVLKSRSRYTHRRTWCEGVTLRTQECLAESIEPTGLFWWQRRVPARQAFHLHPRSTMASGAPKEHIRCSFIRVANMFAARTRRTQVTFNGVLTAL